MATGNDYGGLIDPQEVELIAWRARCFGFREDEMADLEQEIVPKLIKARFRGNGRARRRTFVVNIINRQISKIRRDRQRGPGKVNFDATPLTGLDRTCSLHHASFSGLPVSISEGGTTTSPNGPWMAQQARNMRMLFEEEGKEVSYIIKDADTKFTAQFDAILESNGATVKQISRKAPNMNPFCEAWIGSFKREVLDRFIVFGERHLEHLSRTYERHYNSVRVHSSLDTLTRRRCSRPSSRNVVSRQSSLGNRNCATASRVRATSRRARSSHTPTGPRSRRSSSWGRMSPTVSSGILEHVS